MSAARDYLAERLAALGWTFDREGGRTWYFSNDRVPDAELRLLDGESGRFAEGLLYRKLKSGGVARRRSSRSKAGVLAMAESAWTMFAGDDQRRAEAEARYAATRSTRTGGRL